MQKEKENKENKEDKENDKKTYNWSRSVWNEAGP